MQPPKKLVELALEVGFLDMERVLQAQKIAAETGLRLASVLVRYRFVNADRLARFLSSSLKVDVLDLSGVNPSPLVARLIPEEACRKLRVLPVGIQKRQEGELLNVAMIDPTDDAAVRHLEMRLAKRVRPLLVEDGALEKALERVFAQEGFEEVPTVVGKSMSDEQRREAAAQAAADAKRAAKSNPPLKSLTADAPAFEDHVVDLRSVIDERPYRSESDEAPPTPAKQGPRVCFVSTDQVLTMIVESGLSSLVGRLEAADDIDVAFGLAHKGQVDAVVLCEPAADAATRSLVAQLTSMAKAKVVVVSTLKAWRAPDAQHAVVDPPENLLTLPDAILRAIQA